MKQPKLKLIHPFQRYPVPAKEPEPKPAFDCPYWVPPPPPGAPPPDYKPFQQSYENWKKSLEPAPVPHDPIGLNKTKDF